MKRPEPITRLVQIATERAFIQADLTAEETISQSWLQSRWRQVYGLSMEATLRWHAAIERYTAWHPDHEGIIVMADFIMCLEDAPGDQQVY